MTEVQATFDIAGWDEHQFDRHAGAARLTTASVKKTYSGDIDGTSVTKWAMAYGDDGTAEFVGVERITGTVAGRAGTLVVRHVGRFEGGAASATLTVVGPSCTGDLAGATGGGDFVADPNGRVRLALEVPQPPAVGGAPGRS